MLPHKAIRSIRSPVGRECSEELVQRVLQVNTFINFHATRFDTGTLAISQLAARFSKKQTGAYSLDLMNIICLHNFGIRSGFPR